MKRSISPTLCVLILSLVFLFSFSSCSQQSEANTGGDSPSTETNSSATDSDMPTEAPMMDSTAADSANATDTADTEETSDAGSEATIDMAAWASLEGLSINCGGGEMNLAVPVNMVATRLESQNLAYNDKPFTDCSGIFHRVLDSLKRRCPTHDFPDPQTHRDSRSLGRWYHEKGQLVQITDPLKQDSYLKPGAVVFYAKPSVDPLTVDAETLFKQGGIRHVGVVTEVEKDASGTIVGYTLFHGRYYGKSAAKTNYHKRDTGRANYPPFGNGKDHMIAVAPIASDAVMVSAP